MLVLDLPPQVQMVIEQNAKEVGISPEQLATQILSEQFRIERPFNFDLDEMEQAINSGFTPPVPKEALKDLETFEKWLVSV